MPHGIYEIIGPDRASIAWWQICVRASVIFVYGVLIIRVAGKRAFARQSALDIILTVLIGSALARAMTGNAPFFGTIAGTGLLTALYYGLIHLTQKSDSAGFLLKGEPLVLVRDGTPDEQAMRQAGVSHLDLEEAVRESGLLSLNLIDCATFERSGRISVVPRKVSGISKH